MGVYDRAAIDSPSLFRGCGVEGLENALDVPGDARPGSRTATRTPWSCSVVINSLRPCFSRAHCGPFRIRSGPPAATERDRREWEIFPQKAGLAETPFLMIALRPNTIIVDRLVKIKSLSGRLLHVITDRSTMSPARSASPTTPLTASWPAQVRRLHVSSAPRALLQALAIGCVIS